MNHMRIGAYPGKSQPRNLSLKINVPFWKKLPFHAIIVSSAIIGTATYLKLPEPDIDQYGCPIQTVPTAHTIFLVDVSTKFTQHQKEALALTLDQLATNLAPSERLTTYVFPQNGELMQRVVSYCSPGMPSKLYAMFEGPDANRQKQKLAAISKTIQKYLEPFANGKGSAFSPIMETIAQAVQIEGFSPSLQKRHLILFSDMMQHTLDYSQLPDSSKRDPLNERHFFNKSKGHFARFSREQENYNNLEVTVYYLNQAYALPAQKNPHINFWKKYFNDLGAKNIGFEIP